MYQMYKFSRECDARAGFVIVNLRGFGTESEFRSILASGTVTADDRLLFDSDGFDYPVPPMDETFDRLPSSADCGTTNALDYAYRQAIGNPVTVWELIEAGRLYLQPDRYICYDCPIYMLRVVEYAARHSCLDSLMRSLGNLCCREDCVIVMCQDNPVGSFFWRQLTPDEHAAAYQGYKETGQYILPKRWTYHGGLIGHRKWVDGVATSALEWSVHT